MTPITRVLAGMVIGLGLTAPPPATAQTTGPATRSLMIDSMYGPDLYKMYCASCHGRDGKGSGPVAPALKVSPPDLTGLSRRQNGAFPAAAVEAAITGPATISAHGSDEMPVWGVIFRALEPSDARTRARIKNLVAYIQTIQQK